MTTSGTATTTFDLNELVEEAYERVGKEMRTGHDLRTARRSLNILFMEWANRGVNMWTVEQGTVSLVADDAAYDLPADTVDLIDFVVRTGSGENQTDASISRISVDTYSSITNKNKTGKPSQLWVHRKSGATESGGVSYPVITVWPVPDQAYTLVYWRLRRIQDAGTGGGKTQDVPFRFVPALISGLAYHLSFKIPEAAPRIPLLKSVYVEEFQRAADEDREKATLSIVPRYR
jgi:hypothetical protein